MLSRSYPQDFMEDAAFLVGEQYRHNKADATTTNRSIAISLKRIADMMEEDRKPRIELAPEGWVGDQEHRRILREGLAESNAIMGRIALAMEAAKPTRREAGSARKGDSAGPKDNAQ